MVFMLMISYELSKNINFHQATSIILLLTILFINSFILQLHTRFLCLKLAPLVELLEIIGNKLRSFSKLLPKIIENEIFNHIYNGIIYMGFTKF